MIEKRLERERMTRREAEEIAERTTRTLYDKQRELLLLEAVVSASNDSTSVDQVLQGSIDAICLHTRWPLGHAYLREGVSRDLVPTEIWHDDEPARFERFRHVTEQTQIRGTSGLPGRVVASGQAEWIADGATDPGFPRKNLGVRGAFAFPIRQDAEVTGVLEFFTAVPVAPDPALLEAVVKIGRHLGRVLERIGASRQVAHQATHDALTGLANRLLLRDRLDLALKRSERRGSFAALLFLDIDRFKDVNDTLGHAAGDRLLTDVADRLHAVSRAGDTVAHDHDGVILARFGGDEFVVLCEDLTSEADAVRIAERIQEALMAPFLLGDDRRVITFSIGIVVTNGAGRDAEELLRDADIAMYRAKERGRGHWEVFDESLRRAALRRVEMEQDLRHALEAGELRLYYQPIVTLDDGSLHSVEALLRWEHPRWGLVAAGEFVPVAEGSALIQQLGEWTLTEACRRASRWRARFGERAPLPVSVNVSARQLGRPGLPDLVEGVLAQTGLRARDLAIEITETALIRDLSEPAESLRALSALGVRILLDDFGTGYSSLSHLMMFPIDALKIDRSFVADLGEDGDGSTIVRAIAGMAAGLGVEVVAEGVERAGQAAKARALGCGRAQGHYFGRPAPPAEIESLVSRTGTDPTLPGQSTRRAEA